MLPTLIAGVDVGGTNVRMGLVTDKLEVVREQRIPTASISREKKTAELLFDALGNFFGDDAGAIGALCIGFPSVISKDRQRIMQTPNITSLDDIAIVEMANQRFHIPVFIEKDVNLLLKNDIVELDLDCTNPVLGFYIGTGYGNSIMIDGQFYTGATGSAGELGHIPLYGNDRVCGCGNRGCVETVVSGKCLADFIEKKYPGIEIRDFFSLHGDDEFVEEFVELLSFPIASEMNILDPKDVVFGGGVVCMKDFPREKLLERIISRLRAPYPKDSVRFHFSKNHRNAGVLGAVRYAIDRIQ